MADGFVIVQFVLSVLAVLCSASLFIHLIRQAPWEPLRVRACLVLAITIGDVLYGVIHFSAAIMESFYPHLNGNSAVLCSVLGPVTYWTIFSLNVWVAILAHYSFSRLSERTTNRKALLSRYCVGWFASTVTVTVVSTGGMYLSGGGFEMSHGYCHVVEDHASSSWMAAIASTKAITDTAVICTAAWMGAQARLGHSAVVVSRAQRIVDGYIGAVAVVGLFGFAKCLQYQISGKSSPKVEGEIYMMVNLLWPVSNCVVYVLFSKRLWLEKKAVGFSCMSVSGSPMPLEDGDSTGWREASQGEIVSRRKELAVRLQPMISDLLPVGNGHVARRLARRIIKKFGTDVAGSFAEDVDALGRVTASLWRLESDEQLPHGLEGYELYGTANWPNGLSDQLAEGHSEADSAFSSCSDSDHDGFDDSEHDVTARA